MLSRPSMVVRRALRACSSSTGRKRTQQPCVDPATHVIRSPYTDVQLSDLNVADYVWRHADRRKHFPALTCSESGRSFTFGEARAASERLSVWLPAALGLRQGDVLGLLLPNGPDFAIAFLAAAAAGVVVTPANPLYTADELSRQFANAGVRAVVTCPELLSKAQEALAQGCGGGPVLVTGPAAPEGADLFSLDELLGRTVSRRTPRPPSADPDSVAALPYSSGTTGLPKGVVLTHRNLVANLCQLEHPDVLNFPKQGAPQDVAVGVLPFFHIYGLNGLLNVGLSVGRHTIAVPRFDPTAFAALFSKYKPTVLALVPPLVMFLTQSELVSSADLSRVRFISCGAAPATKSLIQQFIDKAKCPELDFREGFGLTETSCAALFVPRWTGQDKIGSCGVPLPQSEAKIVDDEGRALPPGSEGELWVSGPQIMRGYHCNEAATSETLTPDGWLRTGDVARVDHDGYVYVVDRLKELIKVKGLQVSPTELEGLLRQIEGVADVAVVGVEDARSGEVPRAFIIREEGAQLSEVDVHRFLEPKVSKHKQLAGGVRFVEQIPKNAAGKILRKQLRDQ